MSYACRWGVMLGLVALVLGGCASGPKDVLYQPDELHSPYAKSQGQALWAVVPPSNASGTSHADMEQVGDALVSAIAQTRGLRALPLDRTLAAMNTLKMQSVRTPAQASALSKALGVDGLVIPTVTAWDPYDPPVVGLTVALHAKTQAGSERTHRTKLDPRKLTEALSDAGFVDTTGFEDRPTAVASLHLDARNHATLSAVRAYAVGRHDQENAIGWRTYVIAMPQYVQFAAHQAVSELLASERQRLTPPPPPEIVPEAQAMDGSMNPQVNQQQTSPNVDPKGAQGRTPQLSEALAGALAR